MPHAVKANAKVSVACWETQ